MSHFSSTAMAHPSNSEVAYIIQDRHFMALIRIAAYLSKYNCIIACAPDLFYSASYLANIAKFMATVLASYCSVPLTSSMRRWLTGEAPVPYQPQIEVTPKEAMNYIRKALNVCRSTESSKLALELAALENDLMASNLGEFFLRRN